MWKKFLGICATTALCLVMAAGFAACGKNQYHAVLYDNAEEWINEEYVNAHRTRGARYGENSESVADDSCPETWTEIVKNQEKYLEIFSDAQEEFEVDFEKEMLIVYTFTTVYHRSCSLTKLKLKDETLTIGYKIPTMVGVGDASKPYQRFFVVKLDKLDLNAAEFTEE